MSIYTRAQIIEKIQKIDLQIEEAQGVSEYDLDTGQGIQRVRRQKLSELLRVRDYWNNELSQVDNSGSGLAYGEFNR